MPVISKLRLDQVLFRELYKAQKTTSSVERRPIRMANEAEGSRENRSLQQFTRGKGSNKPRYFEGRRAHRYVAGSDTVATALTATLLYCLHYPKTLCRLQDEIRSVFADLDEKRSSQHLDSCHYLRACINEALRLSPPVGALLPREVFAGGLNVDDHHFPEGFDIGVPHYALHHNELYYPDPFVFKPERLNLARIQVARSLLKRPHNLHFVLSV